MFQKLSISLLFLVFVVTLFRASEIEANPNIKDDWIALYPDACAELIAAAQSCALCHSLGPVVFNPYGQDYRDNGKNWLSIEDFDSDGDGRTNVEEINHDCTFPGDVTSPNEMNSWATIKALYES